MWSSRPSRSASASASRPWRMRRSARAIGGCQAAPGMSRSSSSNARWSRFLGLAPAADVAQQRAPHAGAMAAEERLGPGVVADDAALAEHPAPGLGPLEVGDGVAGGEERAHRLADGEGVARPAAAGHGHGLVDHGHAFCDTAGPDLGQATVGQGLHLQVDVAEAAGPVEGELGPLGQDRRVVDVASQAGQGDVALLDARGLVLEEPHGPGVPGPGRYLVGQPGAIEHEDRAHVMAACRMSPAAVWRRMAAE